MDREELIMSLGSMNADKMMSDIENARCPVCRGRGIPEIASMMIPEGAPVPEGIIVQPNKPLVMEKLVHIICTSCGVCFMPVDGDQTHHDISVKAVSGKTDTEIKPTEWKKIQEVWDSFWVPLVTDGKGNLRINQIKCELYDYGALLDGLPELFMHITGGRVSKPNTDIGALKRLHDDYVQELVDEAVEEALKATGVPKEEGSDT